MRTYVLNRDWAPFSKGDVFNKSDDNGPLYAPINNTDILAKIPDEYLDQQSYAWRPDEYETYHYIDNDARVYSSEYWQSSDIDNCRLSIGNCFETEKEAEDMCNWLEARRNLIDSGAKFTNDTGSAHYSVRYCKPLSRLEAYRASSGYDDYIRDKVLCFDSEQMALDSIEYHKEDWLVYLGINEKSGEES